MTRLGKCPKRRGSAAFVYGYTAVPEAEWLNRTINIDTGCVGHTKPSLTQDTYAHLFEQARHGEELRRRLAEGFGHPLRDVSEMSASGRNEMQDQPFQEALIVPVRG